MVMLELPDWAYLTAAAALSIGAALLMYWGLLADPSRGRRRCPKCWYEIGEVKTLCCPECGRVMNHEKQLLRPRRRWWMVALAVVLVLGASASGMWPQTRRHGLGYYIPTWAIIRLYPTFDPPSGKQRRSDTSWLYMELSTRLEAGELSESQRSLVATRMADALSPAQPTYESDEYTWIIAECGEASDKTTDALLAMTHSSDMVVRAFALGALTRVGLSKPEIAEILEAILRNPPAPVPPETEEWGTGFIVDFLPTSGPDVERFIPLLINLVEQQLPQARAAVRWLGLVGPRAREALPALERFAATQSEDLESKIEIECAADVIAGRAKTMTEAYSRRLASDSAPKRRYAAVMMYNVKRQFTPEALENIGRAILTENDDDALQQMLTAIANAPRECVSLLPQMREILADETRSAATRDTAKWSIDLLEHPR
ncbi:MAG: hypothetical protein CVV40_00495 [Planctomycetes bacterium HGW-Planctomycetes-2]|nr:MAG: hypothetical protein CVV40_00495 [Planctomycetes bacterium HGW-Planctomycetes-2]